MFDAVMMLCFDTGVMLVFKVIVRLFLLSKKVLIMYKSLWLTNYSLIEA